MMELNKLSGNANFVVVVDEVVVVQADVAAAVFVVAAIVVDAAAVGVLSRRGTGSHSTLSAVKL